MSATGTLRRTSNGVSQTRIKEAKNIKVEIRFRPHSHIDTRDLNRADSSSSFIKMESGAQTEPTARVLFGNANNFTRIRDASELQHYYERPLLVEAWAQTMRDDFELVDDVHRQRNVELQREVSALREKVRLLEEDLRVHVKLLNQIHATAAIKTVMPRSDSEFVTPTPTPPVTPVIQQQSVNQHHVIRRISPTTTTVSGSVVATHTLPSHSYGSHITTHMKIESPNTISTTDSNSIKYTIIASEENENNNCEPIEIQLAEEDGALNLNTSADSGRLEICLSSDEQMEQHHNECVEQNVRIIKDERQPTNSPPRPPMPAQSGILVKRRRLTEKDEAKSVQETHYYYNGYSNEASSTTSVICQPISNEVPTSTSTSASQVVKSRPPSRLSSDRSSISTSQLQSTPNVIRQHNDENVMVSIGPNNTRVPYKLYESINWDSPSIATRKLLMAVFDRQTLATHSMTGKPSPAFKGQAKPQKKRLDPSVTEDIVFVVTRRCKVSDKEVRNAITTKCADENKMMKLQMKKNRNLLESNKENYTNEGI